MNGTLPDISRLPPLSDRYFLKAVKDLDYTPKTSTKLSTICSKGRSLFQSNFKTQTVPAKVCDEEAVQHKALHFLFGVLKLRGVPEAECCHPLWGDYKRALDSSTMLGIALKATFLTNMLHGPFLSGAGFEDFKACAHDLMEKCSDTYLAECSDDICFDLGLPGGSYTITREDWLESDIVRKRTPFVFWLHRPIFLFFLFFFTPSRSYAPALPKAKGKAWFGVMQSFTALQRGWTIYRETLRHALDLEATRCFHLFSFTELLSFSPSFYSISVGSAHSIRLLGTRCPTK